MTRSCRPGLLLALPLLLAAAAPAQAARDLNLLKMEMSRAAGEVKTWLAGRPARVEPFTCPDPGLANGRILTHLFKEALKERGVTVLPTAEVAISGKFRDAGDRESPLVCVKIHIDCSDGRDRKHVEISIHETSVLALLFARVLPVEAKPNMTRTRDGEIFAQEGSPFAVSVRKARNPEQALSVDDFALTRVTLKDGRAQVDLKRGDVYAIALINNSNHDVAVVLTMDGLDTFAFRERGGDASAVPNLGYYIIRKGKTQYIYSWYVNQTDKTNLFKLGERTPAGPGTVGVITAQFFHCWPKPGADHVTDRVDDRSDDKKKQPGGRIKLVTVSLGALVQSIPVLYAREPN